MNQASLTSSNCSPSSSFPVLHPPTFRQTFKGLVDNPKMYRSVIYELFKRPEHCSARAKKSVCVSVCVKQEGKKNVRTV